MKLSGATLLQRQGMPLDLKIIMSGERIRHWYNYFSGNIYISFSGGKDSTVLLHLVRQIYPNIPAVFVDTGLEFPEIVKFVETIENVIWLKPKMTFNKVIENYGYPVISKENAQKIDDIKRTKSDKLRNKRLYGDEKGNGKLSEKWKFMIDSPFSISSNCCNIMKKNPIKKYEKESGRKPVVGTMTHESSLRKIAYLNNGCNSYQSNRPMSTPIAFWLEEDIWEYLNKFKLDYSTIYNMGYERTGCMFCMFGIQHDTNPNRFQKMKETHPKQYNYCVNKLGCGKVLDYMGVEY